MPATAAPPWPDAPPRTRARAAAAPPWGPVEVYTLVLFLSAGLLFIPGSQGLRFLIRAMPYAGSLGLLLLTTSRPRTGPLPAPGRPLLVGALVLMALGVVHPEANFVAGTAQLLFQVSIIAPVFWAGALVTEPARLERVLTLTFLANAASCVVGLLQVFYPERFLPPEFTSLGLAQNPELLKMMTYTGPGGRQILRPCGLTDLPGGASTASAATAMLGLILGVQPRRPLPQKVLCVGLAGVGLLTLYLTQVRSLLIMAVLVYGTLCALLLRLRRVRQARWLAVLGAVLVVGAFAAAWAVGGEEVFQRFNVLFEDGVVDSFHKNRGIFLEYTFTTLMQEYPLGAGMGRWGMMFIYFSRYESSPSPYLHAEIQVTGWLLDGGILLVVLYAAAVASALAFAWRWCRPGVNPRLSYLAAVVFCLNLFVAGQSNAGPCFNTSIGIQFWMLAGALHGVANRLARPSDL